MTSLLLGLPSDVLIQEVLIRLPLASVTSCLRTCKQMHDLITSSPLLTYAQELRLAGMIDNPNCTLPTMTRLSMLREREARWLHLDPKSRFKINPPRGISAPYDLASGICTVGKVGDDGIVTGNFTARLPADENEAQNLVWEGFDLGVPMIDVSLAVETHDLIVFLTCSKTLPRTPLLHFYQFSTRMPHPLALKHIVDIPLSIRNHFDVYADVETSGDNLIMIWLYRCDDSPNIQRSLFVYNWKTAEHKQELMLPSEGLAVLREDLFLTPNTKDNCLDVYHIPPWDHRPEHTDVVHVARLHLPDLLGGGNRMRIYSRGHPNPFPAYQPYPAHMPPKRPFMNDPSAAIIYLLISVDVPPVDWRTYSVLVSRQRLLDLTLKVSSSHSSQLDSKPCSPMAWDTWGPESTRWFECDIFLNAWLTTVSGFRWVRIIRQEGSFQQDRKRQLEVLDFNPLKIRKARGISNSPKYLITTGHECASGVSPKRGHIRLVEQPTVIQDSDVYQNNVVSSLPYISSTYIAHSECDPAPKPTGKRRRALQWLQNVTGKKKAENPQNKYFECPWDTPILEEERIVGSKAEVERAQYEFEVMYFG